MINVLNVDANNNLLTYVKENSPEQLLSDRRMKQEEMDRFGFIFISTVFYCVAGHVSGKGLFTPRFCVSARLNSHLRCFRRELLRELFEYIWVALLSP